MTIDAKDIVPSLWDVQAKPSPTNTWALGSTSLAWSNLYLGPNGANAFDPATGNIGFQKQTAAESAAGITPTSFGYPPGDVRRYGYKGDGTTDDTTAINNANSSPNGRGQVFFPQYPSTAKVTSQIVIPTGVKWVGAGFSENNGTGAGNRGATCILRAFTGANCTVLVSGNDCGIDGLDFDNNSQGTGECVQITGSRFDGGVFSCRNSGGDGLRIGKTDTGVSTINANAWTIRKVITCGNTGAGFRIDDTNTSTSTSFPLGACNANSGFCGHLDSRANGTDGLQIGNANDNVFGMVVSQSNTGCGIRFKTDGTNSGPRCNKILGNDCESNTGNDIQIDAATLPAAAPGLYNLVIGNRSVAVGSRIVDNSTGSLVIQWNSNILSRAYHFGSDLNVLNSAAAGQAGVNMYADTGQNQVGRIYGKLGSGSGGTLTLATKINGGAITDAVIIDQTQNVKIVGSLGVNNTAPPAQSTGWGTPVGGAVILNYNITDAGGANSNTNKVVAQIVTILKANGFAAA